MKLRTKLKILAATLTLASTTSWGALITSTVSGTQGGDQLSAFGSFTTSAGEVKITLTNTLDIANFISAGSEISDIKLTFSNAPGTFGSASSVSGQFGDVTGTTPGTVTYTSTDSFNGIGSPLRWLGLGPHAPGGSGTFSIVGDVVTMEALGGGQPSEMIAPFVADGGQYPNSNSSVTNFNSSVIGTLTIDLFLTGVTAATTITSVEWSFGTGPDHFITDSTPVIIPEGAPEPGSLALLGLGGLLMAFVIRRRRVS
jgi:hypothetical protein